MTTTKAVILARGLGSRMRKASADSALSDEQVSAADAGMKGMIPIGRPFLDYAISSLADAGVTDVCLVIGPEHGRVRDYYTTGISLSRVRVHFAIQEQPRGTADALHAADRFAAGEHVLLVKSDNYYADHTPRALRLLESAGVAVFERNALARLSTIDADRIAKFSVVMSDESGMLQRVVEKPDASVLGALGDEVNVGMNSWSMPPQN